LFFKEKKIKRKYVILVGACVVIDEICVAFPADFCVYQYKLEWHESKCYSSPAAADGNSLALSINLTFLSGGTKCPSFGLNFLWEHYPLNAIDSPDTEKAGWTQGNKWVGVLSKREELGYGKRQLVKSYLLTSGLR